MTKSPLRIPGGKTRAILMLSRLFPSVDHLVSIFAGGLSWELHQCGHGVRVQAYDSFAPLVCYWDFQLLDKHALYEAVRRYHPLSRSEFYELQNQILTLDWGLELAASFYVLNRASMSGTTLNGGMSPGHRRFDIAHMSDILNFDAPTLTIDRADFRVSIPANPLAAMYLDPPYWLPQKSSTLYGVQGSHHVNFAHEELFELLKDRPNWLMSYNDCDEIRRLYAGFPMRQLHWAYGMSVDKRSSELVIGARNFTGINSDG